MIARLSRLRCAVLGHRWHVVYGHRQPYAPLTVFKVCTRTACRGRLDASRSSL